MAGFSIEGLKNGMLNAEKNIRTFEDAIQREMDTIEEYKGMIKVLEEKEAIKNGKNIEVVRE